MKQQNNISRALLTATQRQFAMTQYDVKSRLIDNPPVPIFATVRFGCGIYLAGRERVCCVSNPATHMEELWKIRPAQSQLPSHRKPN